MASVDDAQPSSTWLCFSVAASSLQQVFGIRAVTLWLFHLTVILYSQRDEKILLNVPILFFTDSVLSS